MTTTRHRSSPLPPADEKAGRVEAMFDSIAGRYDLLNRALTLGLDTRCRRRTVTELKLESATVLDIACGTGDLCRELMRAGHQPVGIDFSAGMLASARTTAPLMRGDALCLPVADGSIDGITCGFALRNFTGLEPFLAASRRALRSGGRFAFLEVATPEHRVARLGHRIWFERVVPFVGGLVSDRAAYRYLPASTEYLPDAAALVALIETAGFVDVERTLLRPGAAQLLTGTRP